MKVLSLVCAVALATTVSAQTAETETKAQGVKHVCEMPDMGAVKQLDLTAEQETAIREIHADCARDCAAVKADDVNATAEVKAKHQARIREILTDEQYEKYMALAGPGKADDMDRAKHPSREVNSDNREKE